MDATVLELTPAQEKVRAEALRFRPDADRACPDCLYDIEGLCERWNDVRTCPECAARISPRLVCERWIARADSAKVYRRLWLFTGLASGVLVPIGLFLFAATVGRLPGMELLVSLGLFAVGGSLFYLVFRSAWFYLRMKNPRGSRPLRALIALGITGASTGVFLLVAWGVVMLIVALFPY